MVKPVFGLVDLLPLAHSAYRERCCILKGTLLKNRLENIPTPV